MTVEQKKIDNVTAFLKNIQKAPSLAAQLSQIETNEAFIRTLPGELQVLAKDISSYQRVYTACTV